MHYKKVDWLLILGVFAISAALAAFFILYGSRNSLLNLGSFFIGFSIFFIIFFTLLFFGAGELLLWLGEKRLNRLLAANAFQKSITFASHSVIGVIDAANGQIALLSRYNPLHPQLLDAGAIESASVNGGNNIFGGTAMTSFSFTIDGTSYKIPTYYSKRLWGTNRNEVQDGIQEAQTIVNFLRCAKQKSKNKPF